MMSPTDISPNVYSMLSLKGKVAVGKFYSHRHLLYYKRNVHHSINTVI
jgi:roadblock/LC7 domain-containing protein